MNTCAYGSACWISCILVVLAWLLASSGLLLLSWNKVFCTYTKLKPAKYWQALLLVATVGSFCAPRWYMACKSRSGGNHCQSAWSKKGECPHSQGDRHDEDESDAATSDAKQPAKK